MDILNLYPAHIIGTVVEVLVTVFNDASRAGAARLAANLRSANVRTELYMQDRSLGKQFDYANKKGIPLVAVQGPDEIAQGVVKLKRLADGTEITTSPDALADKVRDLLK